GPVLPCVALGGAPVSVPQVHLWAALCGPCVAYGHVPGDECCRCLAPCLVAGWLGLVAGFGLAAWLWALAGWLWLWLGLAWLGLALACPCLALALRLDRLFDEWICVMPNGYARLDRWRGVG